MVAVAEVLEQRQRANRRRPAAALFTSIALHLSVAVAVLLATRLTAQRPQPLEFVPVTILPVQALGAPPSPTPPPPKPTPPPETKVEEPPPPAPIPDPEVPKIVEPEKPKDPPKKPDKKPPAEPVPARPSADQAPPPPADAPVTDRLGGAEGSAAGQSAFGAAQATFDNPDFTYGYYVDQMLRLIRDRWVRPPLGSGVEAKVNFTIAKDGRVSDVVIIASSGYSSFDLAAMRAVQSASPLPPLPRSYRHDTLGVTLVVR